MLVGIVAVVSELSVGYFSFFSGVMGETEKHGRTAKKKA